MDVPRTYELLERLINLLRAAERQAGAQLGLQPVHLHAVHYLARCNRYSDTLTAVHEYLGVTKGTASQTMARLQERGLVRGVRDAADGRKIHLELTARGRRVVAKLIPPEPFRAVLARWPTGASGAPSDLTELLRELQRANGGRVFGECKRCRHLQRLPGGQRCGLTGEALSGEDVKRLCREFEPTEG